MALSDLDRRIVAAAAETMFPPGGAFDTDGLEADVVAYVDDYLDRLPWLDRLQLIAFLRAFDVALAWFEKRPSARFHTADPVTRREYLDSWETSPSYSRRMAFQALRMVLTFAYTESPTVREAMGMDRPEGDVQSQLDTLVRAARTVAAEAR